MIVLNIQKDFGIADKKNNKSILIFVHKNMYENIEKQSANIIYFLSFDIMFFVVIKYIEIKCFAYKVKLYRRDVDLGDELKFCCFSYIKLKAKVLNSFFDVLKLFFFF